MQKVCFAICLGLALEVANRSAFGRPLKLHAPNPSDTSRRQDFHILQHINEDNSPSALFPVVGIQLGWTGQVRIHSVRDNGYRRIETLVYEPSLYSVSGQRFKLSMS